MRGVSGLFFGLVCPRRCQRVVLRWPHGLTSVCQKAFGVDDERHHTTCRCDGGLIARLWAQYHNAKKVMPWRRNQRGGCGTRDSRVIDYGLRLEYFLKDKGLGNARMHVMGVYRLLFYPSLS